MQSCKVSLCISLAQGLDIVGAAFKLLQEQPEYKAIPDEQKTAVDSMISSLQQLMAVAPSQVLCILV